ncbi:MAG: hypothetical protein RLZZ04_316 [Cyanobacteriota bacterium]|jgi:hypothetical protein
MKAIVANVLFGGIFGCLSCSNSTQAAPTPVKREPTSSKQVVSLQRSAKSSVPIIPQVFEAIDNVLTINDSHSKLHSFNSFANYSFGKGYPQWLEHATSSKINLPLQTNYYFPQIAPETDCGIDGGVDGEIDVCQTPKQRIRQLLSAPQQIYVHKINQAELALGWQQTFWPSDNQHKYWGITTVEHWDKNWSRSDAQLVKPGQLNYIDASPALALGTSSFTFSGGGDYNLAKPVGLDAVLENLQEFENFRGGITFHHGVAQQLTMGVGLVYEHTLVGFTQVSYNSDILPIKTTISLLAKESGVNIHSHIRLQPAPNFVANFYSDAQRQKFDANWGIYPGLTLIAKANSRTKSYSTGIRVAVHNDFLSLSATAALDNQQNLQWQLNSQIGPLKFSHSSNQYQSNSELSSQLFHDNDLDLQCSAFVRHQTVLGNKEQREFMVLGARIHSQTQISQNQYQWDFDLGYGSSSHGNGLIANAQIALQPDLFLKLGYQEIAPMSDDTKIKLQLSSNRF